MRGASLMQRPQQSNSCLLFRAATELPVIMDSGVETGLDVLRALALGADFVMLGRAWHYGLGALGEAGAAHVMDILAQGHGCQHGADRCARSKRPAREDRRKIAFLTANYPVSPVYTV